MEPNQSAQHIKGFEAIAKKSGEILKLISDSRVDDLTKKRLEKRIKALEVALERQLFDFAVTKPDTPLLDKSGKELCSRSLPEPFTVISETSTQMEVALTSWVMAQDCISDFSRFTFQEARGFINKSNVLGTKFAKLLPAEKRLAENKVTIPPPKIVLFFGQNLAPKPTLVKAFEGKEQCKIDMFGTIAVKIDELSLESRNGSNAELAEPIEGCATLKVGDKISINLIDIQQSGG